MSCYTICIYTTYIQEFFLTFFFNVVFNSSHVVCRISLIALLFRNLQFNETTCYEINYEICNSTKQRVTKSITRFAIQRNNVYITKFVIQRNNMLRNQLRNLQFNEKACYEINVITLSNFEQFLIYLFNLYNKLYDN